MQITDAAMTSDTTRHEAYVDNEESWAVSWLPGRVLDRNSAVTAMTIAETVAKHDSEPSGQDRLLVATLAGELGLTEPEALRKVTA